MSEVKAQEKERVINYMMSFYCGYRKAGPRIQIAFALGLEDRYFRQVCAEIPEIITSSFSGYYILPLIDLTGEEAKAARNILENEDRRRIIALYLRNRKQKAAVKKMQDGEKQYVFGVMESVEGK